MILEFKIKNYRSVRDEQVLSFEATKDKTLEEHYVVTKNKTRVLKMAIMYGANASGKTNILLALDFLRDLILNPKVNKEDKTGYIPFLLDDFSKGQNGHFEISFFIDQNLFNYRIELNANYIVSEKLMYYPGSRPALIFHRTYDETRELTQMEYGSKINLKSTDKAVLQGNTIRNMSVVSAFSKTNIDFRELEMVYHYFRNEVMRLVQPGTNLFGWTSKKVEESEQTMDFILNLLNNADFNITKINLKEREFELDDVKKSSIESSNIPTQEKEKLLSKDKIKLKEFYFTHLVNKKENYELPIFLESAGTQRYYGLGGVLNDALKHDRCLLIDEIENSLHPDLVVHFINTFLVNSREAQLIFTTHDLNIMEEQDSLRKDVIWFTEKNKIGYTELFSISDFNFRKTLSFVNAYKSGKFGAKPNLGSIYLTNK